MVVTQLSLLVFAVCIVSLQGVTVDVSRCLGHDLPVQYVRTFRDHCFLFVVFRTRYQDEARADCRRLGGHLVTVPDMETNSFLGRSLLELHDQHNAVWIGLTDEANEGVYTWENGEKATWTNFHGGQSLLHSLEDCVLMERRYNWQWTDAHCHFVFQAHEYICEFDMKPEPKTTAVPSTSTTTVPTTLTDATFTTPPPPTQPPTSPERAITPLTTDKSTVAKTLPPTTPPTRPTTTPDTTPMMTTTTPPTTTPTTGPSTTTTGPITTTTAAPTTTTAAPTTTEKPTTQAATKPAVTYPAFCGDFVCSLDCGVPGYALDVDGCPVCDCAPQSS